jgi:DNA-binding MarR family transcriptional regulator
VERLRAAGLIAREPCRDDRRGAFAVLTAEGTVALNRAWPVYARGIVERFAASLTEEEARVIAAALGRVADADNAAGDREPGPCGT